MRILNQKIGTKILVPTMLFIAIVASLLISNLIQIKKSQLQNSLSQEARIVENILQERFDATFFLIEKMSKEIAKNPHDKVYIKKVLERYKSDTSLNQIFSWTIFSWADENSQIIVDGEYGIMKTPFDLSKRDYVQESILKPWQRLLGKPVYGSTSKKWMIPGGVGVTDANQRILGTMTIGFEIDSLAKIIQEALKDGNVNVELVYDNKNVFDVNKSFIQISSGEESSAQPHNHKDAVALERKIGNYPYRLILTYDKKAVAAILWEIIYSRIMEILAVVLLSFALLRLIYRSEKEKSEKAILSMQREVALNKSKSEFILRVGHELRNFVAAIIGLSDLVKEDLKNKKSLEDEDIKEEIEHLDHIKDISDELMSFVSDLIDLNQMEDGRFEVKGSSTATDFEDMIERSVRILKNKIKNKGVAININFEANLNQIANLDRRRIKQILVSIIGNAINYSSKDSKIDIVVKNLDQKRIIVAVKDCGIGMSEMEIKTALANYNFTGSSNEGDSIELKLPIVRFLVEKQNGTMEINSTKEYGTTVKIIF